MGSSTHEASTNGNDKDRSDLTHIRGIGAIRKQWLNSIGIYTIADLARASIEELESQAKHDGRSIVSSEIEAWIAQAQALVASSPTQSLNNTQSVTQSVAEPIEISDDPSISESSLNVKPRIDISAIPWQTVASFAVEYQVQQTEGKSAQRAVIRHLETDAVEIVPEFESEHIHQWMSDRIQANLPPAAAGNPIVPEITQLRVIQPHQAALPMIADQSSPLFPDAIQTDEPFALEVSMKFAGLADDTIGKQLMYRVQCIARNLTTSSTANLGEVTANVPLSKNSAYKALLPEMMLSHPGLYRLKVLVTLQNALATPGCFKVPMLQVV